MPLDNTSIDQIKETVQRLCDFGQKVAGTEAEIKASNYLYYRLKSFGFSSVEKQAFDVHGWNPRSCTVTIKQPVDKELESALFSCTRIRRSTQNTGYLYHETRRRFTSFSDGERRCRS